MRFCIISKGCRICEHTFNLPLLRINYTLHLCVQVRQSVEAVLFPASEGVLC